MNDDREDISAHTAPAVTDLLREGHVTFRMCDETMLLLRDRYRSLTMEKLKRSQGMTARKKTQVAEIVAYEAARQFLTLGKTILPDFLGLLFEAALINAIDETRDEVGHFGYTYPDSARLRRTSMKNAAVTVRRLLRVRRGRPRADDFEDERVVERMRRRRKESGDTAPVQSAFEEFIETRRSVDYETLRTLRRRVAKKREALRRELRQHQVLADLTFNRHDEVSLALARSVGGAIDAAHQIGCSPRHRRRYPKPPSVIFHEVHDDGTEETTEARLTRCGRLVERRVPR